MSPANEDQIDLTVDGRLIRATAGMTVAAAMMSAGIVSFRQSITGASRGPVCGMGICHECRVTINGVPHRRACMVVATAGMAVATGDEAFQ